MITVSNRYVPSVSKHLAAILLIMMLCFISRSAYAQVPNPFVQVVLQNVFIEKIIYNGVVCAHGHANGTYIGVGPNYVTPQGVNTSSQQIDASLTVTGGGAAESLTVIFQGKNEVVIDLYVPLPAGSHTVHFSGKGRYNPGPYINNDGLWDESTVLSN